MFAPIAPSMIALVEKFFFTTSLKLAEEDKRLHLAWCFWLTTAFSLLWPIQWVVFAVFMIGVAKECWDARYGSGFCFYDLTSNVLGIVAGLVFSSLMPVGLREW